MTAISDEDPIEACSAGTVAQAALQCLQRGLHKDEIR
jgi:hypothetical protein